MIHAKQRLVNHGCTVSIHVCVCPISNASIAFVGRGRAWPHVLRDPYPEEQAW